MDPGLELRGGWGESGFDLLAVLAFVPTGPSPRSATAAASAKSTCRIHVFVSLVVQAPVIKTLRSTCLENQSVFFSVGGCGAIYEIFVESEDFRGKRQVQQH